MFRHNSKGTLELTSDHQLFPPDKKLYMENFHKDERIAYPGSMIKVLHHQRQQVRGCRGQGGKSYAPDPLNPNSPRGGAR